MNIAIEELLQLLGSKNVEIFLLKKQIAELTAPKAEVTPIEKANG